MVLEAMVRDCHHHRVGDDRSGSTPTTVLLTPSWLAPDAGRTIYLYVESGSSSAAVVFSAHAAHTTEHDP